MLSQSTNVSELEHSARVREMFAGIAGRYDFLNHLLSGNSDKRWRKIVGRSFKDILAKKDSIILDVACGTGDLSLTLARSSAGRIVGIDFCRPMLEIAKRKPTPNGVTRVPFIEGDALTLPFSDSTFDGVTIAFGLRNLSSADKGIRELLRILKPAGRVAILEFSTPVVPGFQKLFKFYFSRILPRLGGWLSGSRSAYEYLPDSVSRFPDQKTLASMMRDAGFEAVEYKNLTGGIAALHIGTRPVL